MLDLALKFPTATTIEHLDLDLKPIQVIGMSLFDYIVLCRISEMQIQATDWDYSRA